MAVLILFVFIWLVWKALKAICKAIFRPRVKTSPKHETAITARYNSNMTALLQLQSARDTQQQLIDYIGQMLYDECTEKETIALLRQKAIAEKQLATIEKQIYNLIK